MGLAQASTVELKPAIERDSYGRVKILLPDGSGHLAYARTTKFVDVLDDKTGVGIWQKNNLLSAIASDPGKFVPEIQQAVASGGGMFAVSALAERIADAGDLKQKAKVGDAIHHASELWDQTGRMPEVATEAIRYALAEYIRLTAGWKHGLIEDFSVCDELQTGGTPDRISYVEFEHGPDGLPFKGWVIVDIKSGNIHSAPGKIAAQLAIYAHSQRYDIPTDARSALIEGEEVRTDWGVVIHLPQDGSPGSLHWADLRYGWSVAQLAGVVNTYRKVSKRKGVSLRAFATLEKEALKKVNQTKVSSVARAIHSSPAIVNEAKEE